MPRVDQRSIPLEQAPAREAGVAWVPAISDEVHHQRIAAIKKEYKMVKWKTEHDIFCCKKTRQDANAMEVQTEQEFHV